MLPAGGVDLSGLLAEPNHPPRATVLALHGGGMTAAYFHGQSHPDLSLLTLGRQLGYSARVDGLDQAVARRQRAAGHNISLGWAAPAYHLAALAFAGQCLLLRGASQARR